MTFLPIISMTQYEARNKADYKKYVFGVLTEWLSIKVI